MSTPQQPYGAPQYGGTPGRPPYGAPPPPGYGQPPAYGYPGAAQPPSYGYPGPAQPPAYGYPGPAQQPVPQQPYGGPGGPAFPPPPGPGPAAGAPAGAPKARKGLRFWLQMSVLGAGAVVLVVALFSDSAPGSKVGDCLDRYSSTRVSGVSCSDPKANYQVVKRYNSSLTSMCAGTPNVTATYRGTYGRRFHRKHYVLCLAPYRAGSGVVPGASASPKKF